MRLAGYDHASSADIGKLATAVGVSYQAVKKVLDGTSKMMAADNNARAAKLLNVDSDWLALGVVTRMEYKVNQLISDMDSKMHTSTMPL